MHTLIILSAKYLFLVSILVAIVVWFLVPKLEKVQLLKLAILSLPFSLIVGKLTSHLFYDARPFVVNHTTPLIAHAADNGFPSDHTLLTMTIAVIFLFAGFQHLQPANNANMPENQTASVPNKVQLLRNAGIVLFIIGVLVGIARVMAQVHHPIDIVGSTVIAFVCTAIVWYVLQKWASLDRLLNKVLSPLTLQ